MNSPQTRCIVGLGNPSGRYGDTRHNAGFWFVDELARKYGAVLRVEPKFHGETCRTAIDDKECWLLKPSTYMNRSGQSVSALSRFYKIPIEEILIAHDELDMPPGVAKLKVGGGHGGHNGLRDISSAIGTAFLRLRIGIGHPGHRDAVTDYVLSRPTTTETQQIKAALSEAVEVIPELLAGNLQKAMNRLHASSR